MSPARKTAVPTASLSSTRVARDGDRRELTDPREIRALAHPVRVALLDMLAREGPLTATQASELLDESPANCSFHLRTLAKYGFVEETGGGSGRTRPWRRINLGQSFSEASDDNEVSMAAHALAELSHERTFSHIRRFFDNVRAFPRKWQKAAFASDVLLYLTAEELDAMANEIIEIQTRYKDRTLDRAERPAGSAPVRVAAFGVPLPPTPSGN